MSKPGSTPTIGNTDLADLNRIAEQNRAAALAGQIADDAALVRLACMAHTELDLGPTASRSIWDATQDIAEQLQQRARGLQRFLVAGGAALALASVAIVAPTGTTPAQAATVVRVVSTPAHPVVVVRKSLVTAQAVAIPGGAYIAGSVKHYDAPTNSWKGDQNSPVQVQALELGRWVTPETVTTAPDGSVAAVVYLPTGVNVVRLVRPAGATVTGGASVVRVVTVPAMPAADGATGWDY